MSTGVALHSRILPVPDANQQIQGGNQDGFRKVPGRVRRVHQD
jgi:hypothetical protein